MMEDPKVIMLHSDLKSFYISSLELGVLKSTHSLDQKRIQSVKVLNDDFDEVIDLKEINLIPTTLEEYISSIERELIPKSIMGMSLQFDNDTYLNFQTGELSLSASDPNFIQNIAIELLDLCGYDGTTIFERLKSNKQFYISVSEDSEFEYLYPHPLSDDETDG
jgi:hypothetical protein